MELSIFGDTLRKPPDMFDRDFEWAELDRFATYPGAEPTLGVVSGRRRQGKTFLLDALCQQTGGFYFAATEATEAESLRQFGAALSRHVGQRVPYRFEHWEEAVEVLMSAFPPESGPTTVAIDEFPFLVRASPELPSLLQRALGPRTGRTRSPIRLLLCGSALSFMGNLLTGTAPLRGRASLELVVPTLDYRLAADFWRLSDPELALLVNAAVGGTPAYAREFTLGDKPADLQDFAPWVKRNVLNPGRPLFREARLLLAEEPDLRETTFYNGVLSAIATGNHTRGGIASYLGRKSTDLGHALTVLEDTGMVTRSPDAFRGNRSAYRIAEPILTFYHAIMRPEWSDLERPGRADQVWERQQPAFLSNVIGPHFEEVCRTWARWYAAPETLGGRRARVESGTVADPVVKTSHQVDVAVFGARQELIAIGESKWHKTMTVGHLERLERVRELLSGRGVEGAENARLLCFGTKFSEDLRNRAAESEQVQLIDLDRLYYGT